LAPTPSPRRSPAGAEDARRRAPSFFLFLLLLLLFSSLSLSSFVLFLRLVRGLERLRLGSSRRDRVACLLFV
jgi:hypothetical protein